MLYYLTFPVICLFAFLVYFVIILKCSSSKERLEITDNLVKVIKAIRNKG